MVTRMLRPEAVYRARGKSRAAHYADVSAGLFTRPVKLGPRASGWPEYELAALQAAQIAGKTPDQIRALVARLEAERKIEVLGIHASRTGALSGHEGDGE